MKPVFTEALGKHEVEIQSFMLGTRTSEGPLLMHLSKRVKAKSRYCHRCEHLEPGSESCYTLMKFSVPVGLKPNRGRIWTVDG
jgi:hypothetical protein